MSKLEDEINHIIHVTIAGSICACGNTYPTSNGEYAMKMAMHHFKSMQELGRRSDIVDHRDHQPNKETP